VTSYAAVRPYITVQVPPRKDPRVPPHLSLGLVEVYGGSLIPDDVLPAHLTHLLAVGCVAAVAGS
jgi:hypothetical protein